MDDMGAGPCPRSFNLTEYVLAAGLTRPDKIALEMIGPAPSAPVTYSQLRSAVLGTATGLVQSGLKPGDRALLRLGNEISFPIAYLACIAAGILPVPTSVSLTKLEIDRVATSLSPTVVLASPGVAIPDDVPVITNDELSGFETLPELSPIMGDSDRPAYIVLTSGTSGSPRLVVHAHRAVWARRSMWAGWYGLTDTDRMAHAGAFNWTYTLGTGLIDPWACGATALIPQADISRQDLPKYLNQSRATIFAAAPGVFRQILKANREINLPDLRHGLTAGEKCPETIREKWREVTGTELHEAFGQSEVSTFISGSPSKPAPNGTLGYPQAGRNVSIVDDQGHRVPEKSTGNIAIHESDPGLMLGIWNSGRLSDLETTNGYYMTGDFGSVDADGAVTYLGRGDDLINAGGFRVSPIEIETAMIEIAGVTDAAAVELPITADTSIVAVFYTSDREFTDDELSQLAATNLAEYKRPRIFRRLDELPRNSNGKLLRRSLREAYGWAHDKT